MNYDGTLKELLPLSWLGGVGSERLCGKNTAISFSPFHLLRSPCCFMCWFPRTTGSVHMAREKIEPREWKKQTFISAPCLFLPHHCGSLVQPSLCALFLPPGFCLFKVTKILSRSILRKYLRGSLPSKVPSGVPLDNLITGGQCPSFQSPSKHPSHQTLHNCHIMCPKVFSGLPSFPSTFWGTPWLLYNWWTMSIFPVTFQTPFAPNPSKVPYYVPNFLWSTFLPSYLLGYPLGTL